MKENNEDGKDGASTGVVLKRIVMFFERISIGLLFFSGFMIGWWLRNVLGLSFYESLPIILLSILFAIFLRVATLRYG